MPHLIDLNIELDAEYGTSAERLRHLLIELLVNAEGVSALTCSPCYPGELPDACEAD